MNPFHGFLLKPSMPPIFSPKVTPDPTESEKLEARLHEAAQQLAQVTSRPSMYTTSGGHHAARR